MLRGRVQSCVRPVCAALMAAGPDEVREWGRCTPWAGVVAGDGWGLHGRRHVGLVARKHRPGDPSGLVGERDRDHPSRLALQQPRRPDLAGVALACQPDDGGSPRDEQAPDVSVALLADVTEPLLAAAAARPRRQAANCRPDRNSDAFDTVAAIALAVIGPMPGIVIRRRLASSWRHHATISLSTYADLEADRPETIEQPVQGHPRQRR